MACTFGWKRHTDREMMGIAGVSSLKTSKQLQLSLWPQQCTLLAHAEYTIPLQRPPNLVQLQYSSKSWILSLNLFHMWTSLHRFSYSDAPAQVQLLICEQTWLVNLPPNPPLSPHIRARTNNEIGAGQDNYNRCSCSRQGLLKMHRATGP